jgi:hypothetical protein
MKVVGQELPRVEILEKVTGQSVFGADVRLASPLLVGKILGSPHAHARIKNIDTRKAERLPGVKAVVTARDLPPVRFGRFIQDEEYFARAVRLVGTKCRVAAVDGKRRRSTTAHQVDYEVLPPVIDGLEAMRKRAADSRGLRALLGRRYRSGPQGQHPLPQTEPARRYRARLPRSGPVSSIAFRSHGAPDYIEPHAVLARSTPPESDRLDSDPGAVFIRQSIADIFSGP